MTHHWDEFSKSLADYSLPRRQSLRLLGAALAGAVFSPLATAIARGQDPCKAFCNRCPQSKRSQCLSACQACNGNTSRLGGSCGNYVCCPSGVCNGACSDLRSNPNCGACGNDCRDFGETCCGTYCADLENDFDNCGSCGFRCPTPGPYEFGECIGAACLYACVEGAVKCDGVCSDLLTDSRNCGGCGQACGTGEVCAGGACCNPTISDCFGGSNPCEFPLMMCNGVCINTLFDSGNCGACGNVCPSGYACSSGACIDPMCQFVEC